MRGIVFTLFLSASCIKASPIVVQQVLDKTIGQECVLKLNEFCNSTFLSFKFFSSVYSEEHLDLNVSAVDGGPGFEPSLPMKVLIHGYGGAFDLYNPIKSIRRAYIAKGGMNVIVVNWSKLSNTPCYPFAVINTWHVGQCTAELLIGFEKKYPAFNASATHIIGFSLGAHVAGYSSRLLHTLRGYSVARITGLDPALPLFSTFADAYKLDHTDAHFVDVIHTNVGVLGKVESTGHADFYVNGGTTQKACLRMRNSSLCSHLLAAIYFAESVSSEKGFWGISCPNYYQHVFGWCPENEHTKVQRVPMGEPCQPGTLGVYLVNTSNSTPYALG